MTKKKIFLFYLFAIILTSAFLSHAKVKAANAPALKEGTYLTGQTLSIWPSWSLLGNSLGVNLPSDPINQLATAGTCVTSTNRFCINDAQCPAGETCVLHDPETGWSVANRRFTFACNKDSYAYRYIASTTPGAYTVRAHFEDPGIAPANFNSFVSSFVSTSVFKINDSSGVCNFDQEISSMQSGTCGDGKLNLNKGEQCDPPGIVEYATGCVGAIKNLNVCGKNCRWTASTTLCSNLSKCGNGSIEFGETCDDGTLNGKYNHCNVTCNGVSALGKCGDGTLQSTYEICDPSTSGKEKYALNKAGSCSWDCQKFGPYCGDTIAQTQYGEECDGSQACSVDGNPGVRVCTNNCLQQDSKAAAWWHLEKMVGYKPGLTNKTDDATVNGNLAICPVANCPATSTGKYGNGREFNIPSGGTGGKYLTVASSASLEATSSLTVEAWIFPTTTSSLYQRIVEKGGPSTGKGYDLEFNISATTSVVRFNLWNGTQTSVDSKSSISTGTWTHVVGTYVLNGTSNIAKIYINGVLENTNSIIRPTPIMAKDTGSLAIGKSAGAALTNFFFGSLDEVKIYNHTLSDDEVKNNYQSGWYCTATSTPVTAPSGSCGDNIVDPNEACDRGTADNGRACAPAYGVPCSYCSTDCQNTIEVQPIEYCGNGIIESSEKCEVAGANIFAATNTVGRTASVKNTSYNGYQELACADETPVVTHTIKKGTKSCPDCSLGIIRNCVQCGADVNGVGVEGGLINVLENPITNSSRDPLFAKITSSSLSLSVSNRFPSLPPICSIVVPQLQPSVCKDRLTASSPIVAVDRKNGNSSNLVSYALFNPYVSGFPSALVNSDPICSVSDSFIDKYQMYVNYDWSRPLNFPVVAEPQSWQYDLVFSPVVSSTKRARDIRVVVSWVGSGDFYSGVVNPFISNPQIEGANYVAPGPSYQYATGINYYNSPADFKKYGIWYHGFNVTPGQTSAEAFTIDTANMSGNTYAFYVRSPSYPIRIYKNTAKLKVDVYLPELDNSQYHFGTPARTYYFISSAPSDNQNARYWQVFNMKFSSSSLSVSDIIGINTIVTGPTYFKYTNPLVANPACTEADWRATTPLVFCAIGSTKTLTWTKLTNCVGGVQHPPTEVVSCGDPQQSPTTQQTQTTQTSQPAIGTKNVSQPIISQPTTNQQSP
ncbi:MAG: LamG protein [Parcubacteria group bacterium Gr01-1014_13]|nr:MAG: LamG protein [Parcubacteria group bacterium Gr01-1014_13]